MPTALEKGIQGPELFNPLVGVAVRRGTPPEIVKRLQEESYKALRSSAVTERFATDNAIAGGGPSSEFATFIRREQEVWSDIVRRAGIKPD